MGNIKSKVLSYIVKNKLLDETKKVYVATSGGADSMALLAFMQDYGTISDIEVGAVHVNHGIRGETADRDAKFVEEYCKKNGIEYVLFDAIADGVEVPINASEEWARRLRYEYFDKLCTPGVKVATAHTLSDQTETVIFRMARGSGIKGLCGIPVQRGKYIRPFLCIGRAEVEQLVAMYGTGNITDETNLADDYNRNKIRHHVVPVLKDINQNAEESIGKLCERISKVYAYIEKEAKNRLVSCCVKDKYKYEIDGFKRVDDVILDEMLLQLLNIWSAQSEQYVGTLKQYINANTNRMGATEDLFGELQISNGYKITVTNKYITVVPLYKCNETKIECREGTETRNIYFNSELGYRVEIQGGTSEKYASVYANKFELCNFADASKLDLSKCTIRARTDGDKFKPACKKGGKIGKFLKFIPIAERYEVPVIEYEGQIIWVWGVGFTDGFAPDESTKEVHRFNSILQTE